MRILACVTALLFAFGCTDRSKEPYQAPGLPAPEETLTAEPPPEWTPADPKRPLGLSAEQVRIYLAQLAPMLAGRELKAIELEAIEADGERVIAALVSDWGGEPGFAEAARRMISQKLSASGQKDGVDFELPGNLAAYVVSHELPFNTLLTADYCVNGAGEKIACDTQAPFQAGVLTTRAFLMSRASRFNLTRASTLMRVFACRGYPMDTALQPRIERTTLIPLFQAETPEEQTDPRAASGFGNGTGCYSCHGQFGAHAQLFVRFDSEGLYQASATGIQDPSGELGRSKNGLMASHLSDPAAAASEASQVFGRQVKNLAEAAKVLAESPTFVECQARNLLELALDLNPATVLRPELLGEIAQRAIKSGNETPTLRAIAVETFTDARVKKAVLDSVGGTP